MKFVEPIASPTMTLSLPAIYKKGISGSIRFNAEIQIGGKFIEYKARCPHANLFCSIAIKNQKIVRVVISYSALRCTRIHEKDVLIGCGRPQERQAHICVVGFDQEVVRVGGCRGRSCAFIYMKAGAIGREFGGSGRIDESLAVKARFTTIHPNGVIICTFGGRAGDVKNYKHS